MLRAMRVVPGDERRRERREEVGMARQKAERASIVFRPDLGDVVGLDDRSKGRGDGQSHAASDLACASLRRASSRSPTMYSALSTQLSVSPSRMALQPLSVATSSTERPSLPVKAI